MRVEQKDKKVSEYKKILVAVKTPIAIHEGQVCSLSSNTHLLDDFNNELIEKRVKNSEHRFNKIFNVSNKPAPVSGLVSKVVEFIEKEKITNLKLVLFGDGLEGDFGIQFSKYKYNDVLELCKSVVDKVDDVIIKLKFCNSAFIQQDRKDNVANMFKNALKESSYTEDYKSLKLNVSDLQENNNSFAEKLSLDLKKHLEQSKVNKKLQITGFPSEFMTRPDNAKVFLYLQPDLQKEPKEIVDFYNTKISTFIGFNKIDNHKNHPSFKNYKSTVIKAAGGIVDRISITL